MDWLILVLLVAIVVAGGFIGMLSDWLGRRIGKKKLTFLHFRPRHVATAASFIAGMLASLVTILLVFFTSADVRTWIVKGRHAVEEASNLTRENDELQRQIGLNKTQLEVLNADATKARKSLVESQNRLFAVQARLDNANKSLISAQSKVKQGLLALAANQKRLASSQSQLAAKQNELATLSGRLTSAQRRYRALQNSYSALDIQRKEAEGEVVDLRKERDVLKGEVTGLHAQITTLGDEYSQTKAQLAAAQLDLKTEQEAVDTAKHQLTDAQLELARVESQRDLLGNLAGRSRSEPMAFPIGVELARLPVQSHLTPEEASAALDRLIAKSSAVALQQGAAIPAGSSRAAGLLERQLDQQVVSPEEQKAAIIHGLTDRPEDDVLVATAAWNSFKGEFVPIAIKGYPNPLVYRQGQVLASLHIGRYWPRDRVFQEINDFIRNNVRTKALSDGMIPAAGHDDSLLDLPASETINLVDKLANSVKSVRLDVVARTPARAADTLHVDFEVH